MNKDLLRLITLIIILTIVLAGCGSNPSPAPAATLTQESVSPTVSTTPDPCLPPQIELEAQKVQRHWREFDDAKTLATYVPQGQLSASIADLQRIRREAEDQLVPVCLIHLQKYQIAHMNTVINTLLLFMRSGDPSALDCINIESNTEEEVFCKGVALARQQSDQYLVELARLLGLTVVPAEVVSTPPSETLTP